MSGLQYYGSTSQSIEKRLRGHENKYKFYINTNLDDYTTSFEIIKNGDYKIELMEECNDENRDERESYYIRNFECVNKYIPDRTKKEYMKEYDEKIKEHKEEKAKVKYTCECGSTIRKDSKSKHEKTITHQSFINTR
jgi:hypothetical protein